MFKHDLIAFPHGTRADRLVPKGVSQAREPPWERVTRGRRVRSNTRHKPLLCRLSAAERADLNTRRDDQAVPSQHGGNERPGSLGFRRKVRGSLSSRRLRQGRTPRPPWGLGIHDIGKGGRTPPPRPFRPAKRPEPAVQHIAGFARLDRDQRPQR